jgi:hypothetical protein
MSAHRLSPYRGLDYHLVHTLIPGELYQGRTRSRSFPQQADRSLASFAVKVSENKASTQGPGSDTRRSSSTSTTQGRLLCTQHSPNAGFTPSHSLLRTLHELGSPRRRGLRLHAIADRPTTLTPSTNPRLGVGSQHQELHRCALDGFLGPPSEPAVLTRIPHHLPEMFHSIITCQDDPAQSRIPAKIEPNCLSWPPIPRHLCLQHSQPGAGAHSP